MSKILIVPVGRYANSGAVAQAVAATLPDAAVFNPLADAERAERLLAKGKGDDWLDLLVGEVGALLQQNVPSRPSPAATWCSPAWSPTIRNPPNW